MAKFKNISTLEKNGTDIIKTSFFKNHTYKIQKFFDEYDKIELFFSNPTSKVINFTIDDENYKLNKGCSKIIDVTQKKIINIKSNCLFLRPTIFNYKDKYLDVHHA